MTCRVVCASCRWLVAPGASQWRHLDRLNLLARGGSGRSHCLYSRTYLSELQSVFEGQAPGHLAFRGHSYSVVCRAAACSSHVEESTPSLSVEPAHNLGFVQLIVGPMFSGKTSELLRRVGEHEAAGCNVAPCGFVTDRLSLKAFSVQACFAVPTLAHLREQLEECQTHYHVFAIDEGQFFPDLVDFCRWAADLERRTVIVAGLDGDFRRERFGQVLDLVPLADSVVRLKARCAYCSEPAPFTLRIAADEPAGAGGGR
eukprot:jgi/Botrbrau1/6916/Bobra.67_3s0033.1